MSHPGVKVDATSSCNKLTVEATSDWQNFATFARFEGATPPKKDQERPERFCIELEWEHALICLI